MVSAPRCRPGARGLLTLLLLLLPGARAITCSPPPNIANGMHNGSNLELFAYNTLVIYKCDHNFSLTGEASIHCTTKDNISGVWSGPAPECKGAVAIIGISIACNKRLRKKLLTTARLTLQTWQRKALMEGDPT